MARKKLPEFTAKKLLFDYLDMPYHGISIMGPTEEELKKLIPLKKTENYVVKVDQGVKKRAKQGLIAVKISPYKLKHAMKEFENKGYSRFLVEDFIPHDAVDEKYFAMERTREGIVVYMSQFGGVDIEKNQDKVTQLVIPNSFRDLSQEMLKQVAHDNIFDNKIKEIATFLGISEKMLQRFFQFFEEQYVSFLEINPLVVRENEVYLLDLAVEVDSSGEFFVKKGWTAKDFVEDPSASGKTAEEKFVIQLKENSQASLKLDVLNPNGSIFTMLSGGGASITLADEAYNRGYGKELANYADYSGNPNSEETYLYTKQLLSLLLSSKAPKKTLLIAGGVANFTDVRVTFRGILQALGEEVEHLQKQKVKVFVRRGGPNQIEGLKMMSD
ncbi:MAG TPA: ATP citrate lyase citrate-binding domain-containing protein, partial [Candidatus Saccharimonadales bacterium]|nr:ATP citrate lyase citrate-binding domain-containing protein [Candidatus Saccharimonadales bacterium]